MKTINLPYFGEIGIPLKEYMECEATIRNREPISLYLNEGWNQEDIITEENLLATKVFLDRFEEMLVNAERIVRENYQTGGIAKEYVGWYRTNLEEDEDGNFIKKENRTDIELLSDVRLERVGLFPRFLGRSFAVFDFTPSRELMHHMLVLKFTLDGELIVITAES